MESLLTKFGESFKTIDDKFDKLEKNTITLENSIISLKDELDKLRTETIKSNFIKEEQFPAINKNTENGD